MVRVRRIGAGVLGGLVMAAAGCAQPKMDEAAMKEMMRVPPRPAELDRLDTLAGNWDFTMEMKMAGTDAPAQTYKGTSTAAWDCDRRVLVQRVEGDMGEMGRFYGMGLMTWDPHDRVYRSVWVDNMGEMSEASMTYDEATRTWRGRGENENTMTGEETKGDNMMRMTDANTVEWSDTKWDRWRLRKKMEMTGKSTRRM